MTCWNTIITKNIQYGQDEEALNHLGSLQRKSISPNMVIYFDLEEAFTVFSKQHNRHMVSYNAMTSRYVRNNKGFSAWHSHDV